MGAPSGAIRAGRAFVEMFADSTALIRTLEAAKKRVLEFGKFSAKIGATAAAAGASVFTPIAKMFTSAVEEGADIAKLASRFGSTAEQISVLKGAFAQAGVGASEFAGSLDTLASKISHAADANEPLLDDLRSLGNGRELMGKGLDEQLDIIAERIAAIPHEYDKMRAASELGLGAMSEQLKKGKAGLDEYRAASVKNGDQMSTEQTKQALEIQVSFNRAMLAVKTTLMEVGKALLPTGASFLSVGNDIKDALAEVREWIQQNKAIVIQVTAAAGALLAGGLAVAAFGGTVAALAPIIGGLITAVVAMKAVVLAIFSPIGAVVAGLALVAAGMIYVASQTQLGMEAWKDFKGAVADAAEFIKSSWKGVTDALSVGDFSLAWKIVLKTAEVAWDTFIVKLTTTWIGFKVVFVDAWEDATGFLAKAFVGVAATIENIISGIITKVVGMWNSVAGEIDSSLKISAPVRDSAEIDKEKRDMIKAIDDITAAEKKRRFEARVGELKDAKDTLDIAKDELNELKKKAAAAAEAAKAGKPEAKLENIQEPKKAPSFSALSESAKGTFGSASIAQSLGYGDNVGQRQLDTQNDIKENTKEANVILREMYAKLGGTFS